MALQLHLRWMAGYEEGRCGEGDVTMEAEGRETDAGPQTKECGRPLETEKDKKPNPPLEPLEGAQPCQAILDFWRPKL